MIAPSGLAFGSEAVLAYFRQTMFDGEPLPMYRALVMAAGEDVYGIGPQKPLTGLASYLGGAL